MTVIQLARFAEAVCARAGQWEGASIRWELGFGAERQKTAAWVNCETDGLHGELMVWTSGEAELTIRRSERR